MNALTPQFLNDEDGNAMYAVLPIAQYNELLSRAMEEETDFYYELTDDEIAYFERAEQLSREGKVVSSEEVRKKVRERYGSKMADRS
ncbi:hypothetical protein [Capnocytophaga gingivalis]|jgi:hypothetical protein|uniref:hypothetical protein n=1 Tax=Capnocytophaga gingivalis TaxID=1017 RepID=UPI0023F6D5B1|nr:hypothetical protein [Capnocytophaga gingivalis]